MNTYQQEEKLWRWVITNRTTDTITILDRLASERVMHFPLGAPWFCEGWVPSDSPQVNILYTDGEPFVEEGIRLLYGFRRERFDGFNDLWRCRFAGIIEGLEDATRTESAQSHLTAYDPWRHLYNVPCHMLVIDPSDPTGPGLIGGIGADGCTYVNANPAKIIFEQMQMAVGVQPDILLTDWTELYVKAGDFDPFDELPYINYTIQQGTSVGQLLTDFAAYAYCDIYFEPSYDTGEPGVCSRMDVITRAGNYNPSMIFSWDKPPRSLVGASKLKDGTRRANRITYYAGQGGAPLPPAEDTGSQATYGVYEEEQFWPGDIQPSQYDALQAVAADEVFIRRDGQITVAISPAPERSPSPFTDFIVGDWGPVYWTNRMREETVLVQRVVGMTLSLSDNGVETITELLMVVSDRDQPAGFAGGPPATRGPGVNYSSLITRIVQRATRSVRRIRPGRVGP